MGIAPASISMSTMTEFFFAIRPIHETYPVDHEKMALFDVLPTDP